VIEIIRFSKNNFTIAKSVNYVKSNFVTANIISFFKSNFFKLKVSFILHIVQCNVIVLTCNKLFRNKTQATVSTIKNETSKKLPKKWLNFFPDFCSICGPCPFPQLDGISACFDNFLLSKIAI
jgi:hypothetical protein